MTVSCAAGYYCPLSTSSATQYSCPAGTYSDATNLVKQASCTQCPERYSCATATTSSTLTDCPAGSYCPAGTSKGYEIACPAGTYSNRTRLKGPEECTPCPPGFFCNGGTTTISGTCSKGYYCPSKTSTATSFPCPAGTYSSATDLFDATQCTPCAPGYYCPSASTSLHACPAGSYTTQNNTKSAGPSSYPACTTCSAGYYCPSASAAEIQCGLGYYSDVQASLCTICPRGHYCGSLTTTSSSISSGGGSWAKAGDPSGICFNGTYCSQGMTRAPDLLRDACPAGFYCPAGTTYPMACPAGTYSGSAGMDSVSDCITTPAGFYSVQNSTAINGMCAPGYYCPAGSTGPKQVSQFRYSRAIFHYTYLCNRYHVRPAITCRNTGVERVQIVRCA